MPTVLKIVSFPQWRGFGPVLWGGLLQGTEWWHQFRPYLPGMPSITMVISMGVTVVGLAVLARSRGRHLGWSLLGLIPLAGPLLGLGALLGPSRRRQVRDQTPIPYWEKVGYWFVCGVFGLVGLFILLFSMRPIITSKVAPDGSARVHVGLMSSIYLDEIRGPFITSGRMVFDPRDSAMIERAIWSRDGKRIIFIGKDSDTRPDDNLLLRPRKTGDHSPYLFIMFDRVSGQIWYNSTQNKQRNLPPFTREEAEAIDWQEPLPPSIVKEGRR